MNALSSRAMAGKGWIALAATPELPIDAAAVASVASKFADSFVVPLPYKPLTKHEELGYAGQLKGALGILLRSGFVTASLLDNLPDMRVIAVHGVGVDPVDVEACTERGVWVTNTPGVNTNAVAEFTLGLMLSLLRGIPRSAHAATLERSWDSARVTGGELRGRTLGVLGLGQIGQAVAQLARVFGMDVLAFDPMLDDKTIEHRNAVPVDLSTLLRRSDILTLHAPSIESTKHVIDKQRIGQMKPGAYLVNCARGALVDENALAEALLAERLAGAALDVLEGEPPDPTSPLYEVSNVIITPHMAGSTVECLHEIAKVASEDIVRVLTGSKPINSMNNPKASGV